MGHFQPTSASAVCSGFWFFSAWPSFPWASLNLKKAVADPKADPYLLYGGYYGLGHYGGYYGYPYYGYYGKRSADAEPVSAPDADAKAEANPWYGYYGHGLGYYGLGYYG